jgi:hypothetical protein
MTLVVNFSTGTAGVVGTGGKFAAGVIDSGCKFSAGVNDTFSKYWEQYQTTYILN